MTLKMVAKKYKGEFALLQPTVRDSTTNRPKGFKVLKACTNALAAEKAQQYYIKEGFLGVFIYPCVEDDTLLDPKHVARMFRILYGGDG